MTSNNGTTPAEAAVRETALFEMRRMAIQYRARKWTHAQGTEYVNAIAAAAIDDIEAVREGVHAAIAATVGNFPPTAADTARHVARARRRHIEDQTAAKRRAERATLPHPNEHAWHGYLARGANHAHLADLRIPATPTPALQPYVDVCLELGYRNRHGCGPWQDPQGHLHAEDPDHDPDLHAQAVAAAEAIWRQQGEPSAPHPTEMVTA